MNRTGLLFALAALAACTPQFRSYYPRGGEVRCDGDYGTGGLRAKTRTAPCDGYCPVYTVWLCADGNVVYEGSIFVKKNGRHTRKLTPAAMESVTKTLASIPDGPSPLDDASRAPQQHVVFLNALRQQRWHAIQLEDGRWTADIFESGTGAIEWIGTPEERERLWQESK